VHYVKLASSVMIKRLANEAIVQIFRKIEWNESDQKNKE